MKNQILAVTMGDPAGIGPEVIIKMAISAKIPDGIKLVVIGDPSTLERANKVVGSGLEVKTIAGISETTGTKGVIEVISVNQKDLHPVPFGHISAVAGMAAYECLSYAVDLALKKQIDGIVTAPLNKEALNLSGHSYPGHTEILKDLTHSRDVAMLLSSESLRVIHVTGHMSLQNALTRITPARVIQTALLGSEALSKMGIENPRIAIAGINPHAGENGLFGNDDDLKLVPAVEELKMRGLDVSGPIPPDTVFTRAYKGEFDLVVAMYHDQGHIPMKMVAFDSAVNITLGLPIVRTSPDHGTAFNIAGTGVANPLSMIEAVLSASSLAGGMSLQNKAP